MSDQSEVWEEHGGWDFGERQNCNLVSASMNGKEDGKILSAFFKFQNEYTEFLDAYYHEQIFD